MADIGSVSTALQGQIQSRIQSQLRNDRANTSQGDDASRAQAAQTQMINASSQLSTLGSIINTSA